MFTDCSLPAISLAICGGERERGEVYAARGTMSVNTSEADLQTGPSEPSTQGEKSGSNRRRSGQPGALSFLLIGILLVFGLGAFLMTYVVKVGYDVNVSAAIPMIASIVLGVSGLLLLFFAMASGFKRLGLVREGHALGLPEGSIRAVLALSLIVTFVAFNFYLFRSVNYPLEAGPVPARTADQVAAIDPALVVRVVPSQADPQLYDVYIRRQLTGDAQLMVQQVTTTLGTLVVAVSAFYFGSTVGSRRDDNSTSPEGAAGATG
jgi:hypothetical protein